VPDDEAEEAEFERDSLMRLQRVLDWQPYHGEPDADLEAWPEKIRQGLRETIAYQLICTWVELRCVDTLVGEIGESFNGIDPLRPVFREKLDGTREKLLSLKEQLEVLSMDVVLREPLDQELEEMRGWLSSVPV
jgi:hypothetical protein